MLQLRNTSPFVATLAGLPDRDGVDCLIAVVKASFTIGAALEIAAEQRPIALADEYWGEPGASSLRVPGEVHLQKPGTDVIVLGRARAPGGQPVTELDVGVGVGDRAVRLRVHGDRLWTPGQGRIQPSRARPFVDVPLVYERALGGPGEPRNPVGVGHLGAGDPGAMIGTPVPNLEDPAAPLTELGQPAAPVGVGAIAPSWEPRASLAGTYGAHWRRTRAPFLPDDFDPRYLQVGSPGLSFAAPLGGGEPIVLVGMDPRGTWRLSLPRCELAVVAVLAGSRHELQPILDTVVLEPDAACLTMTWRACLRADGRLLRVEQVEIGLAALDGAVEPGGVGQ